MHISVIWSTWTLNFVYARSSAAPAKNGSMKKLLLWTTALLGLEATGLSDIDSSVEGDGDEAGDGEVAVGNGGEGKDGFGLMLGLILGLMLMLGLPGGNDSGEEAGEEGVCSMMGAGEGAWAMDITTRERSMASMSVARASAIVTRGRRKLFRLQKRNRTE